MSDRSDATAEAPSTQPVAWGLLLVPAIAQLLLHVATSGRYGIFRDEYYYLACAARPAWGYVDQPPLSIWILGVWKAVFGDSIHSLRILPALCGSGLILMTGALAAEIGGRRWAQLFAGLAVAIGAAGLVICGFYSMNPFDLLFWTGAYILVVRIARSGDGRWWLWLGAVLGVGLMNKVGILVFGAALASALLATPHRRHLVDKRLWFAAAIAAVFLLPYVIWNVFHDWPTLEFIQNAKRYKISHVSPLGFLSENILEANPMTLPLWLGGLVWLLIARKARSIRLVGLMVTLTWVILVAQKSKPYYFAASFPVLMAAGGVAWESWTDGRRWRWGRWVMVANLLVGAAVFLPIAVPVLSPAGVVAYQKKLGIAPNAAEVGHTGELPQHFSDRLGWEELARTVSAAYGTLSPEDRERCVVVARNYGQAGALEYWSKRYELPPVYCRHNSYWFWGPPEESAETVIAINFPGDLLEEYFDDVVEAGVAQTPFAQESHMTVWVCRGLRRSMDEVWMELKVLI
jgi:hypothetical protein